MRGRQVVPKLIRQFCLVGLLAISVLLALWISGGGQLALALRFLTPPPVPPRPTATGLVGPQGGLASWSECAWASITFSPGSVTEPVLTTCWPVIPELARDSMLSPVGLALDIGIWGTGAQRESIKHFDSPITLRVTYQTEKVEHEEYLALYYYDQTTRVWQPLASKVQPSAQQVEAILSKVPGDYGEGSSLFCLFETVPALPTPTLTPAPAKMATHAPTKTELPKSAQPTPTELAAKPTNTKAPVPSQEPTLAQTTEVAPKPRGGVCSTSIAASGVLLLLLIGIAPQWLHHHRP